MKANSLRSWGLVTVLVVTGALGNGQSLCAQTNSSSATISSPAPSPSPPSSSLPSFIMPTSPAAQVIRLVQAGVEENIVLSYVSNSSSTFNLDSDKIIYLSDVGVPGDVTTAMMQRDQVLQQQMAAAQPIQTAPPPPPPPSSTATYITDSTDASDATDATPPADTSPITVNYFYDSLAPYGSWLDIPGYGRCWRPTIAAYNSGWQPYCDRGQWIYTDAGWYWESGYAWGVTFHYGRWFRDPNLGWCWWPDTSWGPSWVTWRYTDDYCGWAPLPPFAVYQPGLGFVYEGNGISVGFDFDLDAGCFTFVPTAHFFDAHIRRFRCTPGEVAQIYGRTIVLNNFSYHQNVVVNSGIPLQHFDVAGGAPIRTRPLNEINVPPGFSRHPVAIGAQHDSIQRGSDAGRIDDNNRDYNNRVLDQPPQMNTPAGTPSPTVAQRPAYGRPWPPAPVPARDSNNGQRPDKPYSRPDAPTPAPVNVAPTQRFDPSAPVEQRDYGQRTGSVENQPPHVESPPSPHPAPQSSSQSSSSGQKQQKN